MPWSRDLWNVSNTVTLFIKDSLLSLNPYSITISRNSIYPGITQILFTINVSHRTRSTWLHYNPVTCKCYYHNLELCQPDKSNLLINVSNRTWFTQVQLTSYLHRLGWSKSSRSSSSSSLDTNGKSRQDFFWSLPYVSNRILLIADFTVVFVFW